MSAENPKFWALADDESYCFKTIEERLNQYHQECDGHMPETIEVLGLDPMLIDEKEQARLADWALESLLESIDESEFGGPDYTDATDTMKEAAAEFVKKIVGEYNVWSCVEVCRKTVRVADYIKPEDSK